MGAKTEWAVWTARAVIVGAALALASGQSVVADASDGLDGEIWPGAIEGGDPQYGGCHECELDEECGYGNICSPASGCCEWFDCCVWFNNRCVVRCY